MPVQNLIELKNKIKIANWTSKFGLIYTKEEEMKKNIEWSGDGTTANRQASQRHHAKSEAAGIGKKKKKKTIKAARNRRISDEAEILLSLANYGGSG